MAINSQFKMAYRLHAKYKIVGRYFLNAASPFQYGLASSLCNAAYPFQHTKIALSRIEYIITIIKKNSNPHKAAAIGQPLSFFAARFTPLG